MHPDPWYFAPSRWTLSAHNSLSLCELLHRARATVLRNLEA
jgi:hypothetical protein